MITINGNNFEAKGTLDELVQDLLNVAHNASRVLYLNTAKDEHDDLTIGLCRLLADAVIGAQTDNSIDSEKFDIEIVKEEL